MDNEISPVATFEGSWKVVEARLVLTIVSPSMEVRLEDPGVAMDCSRVIVTR